MQKNKILRCVFGADMRAAHAGLSSMLEKNFDIKTENLEAGEYVVCINKAKTIVKIYAGGNVIAHYKSRKGTIDTRTLQYIPKYFNGRGFDYAGAIGELVRKELRLQE
jgi:hypothetical protein